MNLSLAPIVSLYKQSLVSNYRHPFSFNNLPFMGTYLRRNSLLVLIYFILISSYSQANDVYIIHMDQSLLPKAFSTHHDWYLSTLESVSLETPKHIYTYNGALRGFSASLSPTELSSLKASPGFIHAIKDSPVQLDTTHSSDFLGLNPNSGVWATTLLGRGVIVGVVDSGLWPESKSYSEEGMSVIPSKWKGECEAGTHFNSSLCNKKLIGARSFSKGLAAHLPPNTTVSMNSTRDTDGHGTHTSSTAAGNYVEDVSFFGYASGTARGVVPHAHLAMYKTGFSEGTYMSDIIAAIDKAIEDGCDVISLSLGLTGATLYEDVVAIASFGAMREGIFVSTSAGNEGPFDSTLHNGTPWVLTVAASTIDREFHATLDLDNGISVTGQSLYVKDNPFSDKFIPILILDSCSNSKSINATGKSKIIVCDNANERLARQFSSVRGSNVEGAIFISNATNIIGVLIESSFPSIVLSPQDGYKLKNSIKNSKTEPKARMKFNETTLGTKPAPRVTSYSSRGPSPSSPSVLKPDVTAPGDLILAAWPDNIAVNEDESGGNLFSKFNILSGTSMACPHASGVAALVKSAHPDWSPAAIRSAIMTSSDITDNTGRPITDMGTDEDGNDFQAATPLAMGSGHINPNRAINPGLVYDAATQDYINLVCAMNFTKAQISVITGSSSPDCSSPSLDLNYPSFIAFFDGNSAKTKPMPGNSTTVKLFRRTVTNVGEGPSKYTARVTPIKGFKIDVYPKRLEFVEKNEKMRFQVKIMGPKLMEENALFGYLTWEDDEGKYAVRSPIVVTRIKPSLPEN